MTSPALANLGPKPTEPQSIEWIKVRRHAPGYPKPKPPIDVPDEDMDR